jgi:hypothetical protein
VQARNAQCAAEDTVAFFGLLAVPSDWPNIWNSEFRRKPYRFRRHEATYKLARRSCERSVGMSGEMNLMRNHRALIAAPAANAISSIWPVKVGPTSRCAEEIPCKFMSNIVRSASVR